METAKKQKGISDLSKEQMQEIENFQLSPEGRAEMEFCGLNADEIENITKRWLKKKAKVKQRDNQAA